MIHAGKQMRPEASNLDVSEHVINSLLATIYKLNLQYEPDMTLLKFLEQTLD